MRRLRSLLLACALFSVAFETARPALIDGGPSAKPYRNEALAYFENLPESNPYRALLLRYENLPKEERNALVSWSDGPLEGDAPPPSPTEAQLALARELSVALVAAGTTAPTSREDWPLLPNPDDPDNPAAIVSPGIGTVRALAKIAVKDAALRPPGEASAVYASVAQFGRQQRSGSTLIEQLVGVAIEGIAQAEAAKRLNEFSAEELARLSALWDQLKASPSNAEAVAGEREIYFRPLVENVLVPGLRALIENPTAGLQADSSDDEDFTKNLRLSGLMDLGGGQHRIILEDTRSGESLPLDLGRDTERIRLVSLDYEKRVAVIGSGQSEAVVHLESKRIVRRKNPAVTLRKMFEISDLMSDSDSEHASLEKMLTLARKHPEGPEGYGRDLVAAYRAGIDRHLQQAENPIAESSEGLSPKNDPFLHLAVSGVGQLVRTFNSSATQTTMFQAAIQHRLGQLGQSVDHPPLHDPWSDDKDRFVLKPAPDGAGFIMTSRYEVRPGQPVTYKFAAPDAGFIRVTKP